MTALCSKASEGRGTPPWVDRRREVLREIWPRQCGGCVVDCSITFKTEERYSTRGRDQVRGSFMANLEDNNLQEPLTGWLGSGPRLGLGKGSQASAQILLEEADATSMKNAPTWASLMRCAFCCSPKTIISKVKKAMNGNDAEDEKSTRAIIKSTSGMQYSIDGYNRSIHHSLNPQTIVVSFGFETCPNLVLVPPLMTARKYGQEVCQWKGKLSTTKWSMAKGSGE